MKKNKSCFSRKQERKRSKYEFSLKILLASLAAAPIGGYADIPGGLIGGELDSVPYAASLSSSGSVSTISGLPVSGTILSVALNPSGLGLVGGQDASDGYAAFVSANGDVTSLPLSTFTGVIKSVSVNEPGQGLIGGKNVSDDVGYAALVSSDGTVQPLTFSAYVIESVALSDSGVGLIGGEGSGLDIYAAYVASDGTVTPVADLPVDIGHIYGTAINDLGNGIITGWFEGDTYAAFVFPSARTIFISPVPLGGGALQTAAINHSGVGLIGGITASNDAYAGYVTTDGIVTALFDAPFTGSIKSVALNNSGVGLVGGQSGSDFYAALVSPTATLTPLFPESPTGSINAVAINDAGVGLIGGQSNSADPYAALVAPNGTLTQLNLLTTGSINSVALQSLLNETVPQSAGPYASAIFTQLAAGSALETRFIQQNRVWKKPRLSRPQANVAHNDMNLAYNEVNAAHHLALNPKTASTPRGTTSTFKPNSFWLEPFGNLTYLQEEGDIPAFSNQVGGALLGYDRQGSNYIVGATVGYAFNYIGYSKGIGHGKIQEEMASLYGSYYTDHFWAATALWGGLYQFNNVRHTLAQITSTGKTHGWILAPHLEMATPWAIDDKGEWYLEPFFMLDWVNNWQNHYTESGSSGLNLQMPNIYNSLLQSEVGLRCYEQFVFGWGDFCLQEKVSYVNQAPFDFHSVTSSFVASASTFPIAVGSSKVQNLGSVQLLGSFVPRNRAYPYGGFSFQAMANDSYQSYFFNVFGGVDF